ncbi:uncharacterized protein LOC6539177 isoform X2 [Drosophila yakuba]|uniref:Uncharacterized protein, isoform D n=1 Tax=Drosophila yakuba TaxID=7245 RepID=A0A0R1EDC2_DROYA|nr:uncharacterized protein LOC6539177 isoform X2 [Drosophila yakuba]KRK05130.1 uncharacterized protein Dyak_GE11351, isoform D [Drosophila yakuba]
MDFLLYILYELSLLGETDQNDYDNNVLHDILNSSAFCNDTSLDLNELIPDHENELFELHFSSNPKALECSSNAMSSSFAISGEIKRNVNNMPEPNASSTISLSSSNDYSNELPEEAPYPLIVDSDKVEQFFEQTNVTRFNKEFNSTFSNLSDIKDVFQENSKDLGFTSYNTSRINSSLTNTWPINTELYTDHQVSKTDLPLSKTMYLTSHDYKALTTVKCNGDRAFKRNFNVGSKISNNVINKNNATIVQSLKGSTQSHTINEKIYKKHQRMIKNRESASLSRKKRKEYVVSLETRINNLEKECKGLTAENDTIRDQLFMFATSCQCESGNASGLLLNYSGSEGNEKKTGSFTSKAKHCNNNNTAGNIKKNVAILFAMAFIVSLNAGNFQKYLNIPNNIEGRSDLEPIGKQLSMSSRRLLWADSEEEYKEHNKLNTFLSDKPAESPLYFISSGVHNHNINSLENISKNVSQTYSFNEPPPLTYLTTDCISKCRSFNSSSNQSKYFLLAQNLHKWINGTVNMSSKIANEKEDSNGFELINNSFEKNRDIHIKHKRPKMFIDLNDYPTVLPEKQRKLNHTKSFENMREQINVISQIKRRDDTFYVFSFNMDHALFPALSYNSSYRPKLSLVLPLENPGINGKMKMIQVDCEVFNTKDIEVSHRLLSAKLRQNIVQRKPNTQNIKKGGTEKPVNTKRDQNSIIRQTPRVRNFYKVGSRNQATAASSFKIETHFKNK